jgi:hypothetical protein
VTAISEGARDALDAIRRLCDQHYRGRPEVEVADLCRRLGRGQSAVELLLAELEAAGRIRVEQTRFGVVIELQDAGRA